MAKTDQPEPPAPQEEGPQILSLDAIVYSLAQHVDIGNAIAAERVRQAQIANRLATDIAFKNEKITQEQHAEYTAAIESPPQADEKSEEPPDDEG